MNKSKLKKIGGIILLLIAGLTFLALYPLPEQPPIRYFDRQDGLLKTEKVAGEKWLVWLYNNPIGEVTLWTLAKRKVISSFYGNLMDRPSSIKKIEPFVKTFNIDMGIAEKQTFTSFNDFFTRKLKNNARPVDTGLTVVVSPADGKLMAYVNLSNTDFLVKGYRFDVSSFLNNPKLANKYINGTLVIIRLAPFDYHRFHFPIDGKASPIVRINGDYYSVNPFALRKITEIFCLNKREYTVISSPIFGDMVMAEVGATMVGSIIQTYTGSLVKKGEEKGYFKFGGSTVVLLLEKNNIRIDQDLLINTSKGYETVIKEGEKIGVSVKNLH